MPTTTSGFFLQRGSDAGATRDLVVPVASAPFGLAHHRRDGDDPAWRRVATFAEGIGAVAAASLIESNFGQSHSDGPGNLELVARIDDKLAAFWCAPAPEPSWSGPLIFASGATGNPALIQADFGQRGDFELVVPQAGGGIAHYHRDNDSAALPWLGPFVFAAGVGRVDAVAMIQNHHGFPGRLEVIARIGERLVLFWHARASGDDRTWHGPQEVVVGVAGVPALLQGSGSRVELVAPLAGVGLGHWVRDDDAPGATWRGPDVFATELGRCDAVSLVHLGQSGADAPGRLELAVQADGQLLHLVRDGQAWSRRATVSAAPRLTPPPTPPPLRPPAPARPAGPPPQLRAGPHHAGFRRSGALVLSPDARYPSTWAFEGAIYRAPEQAAALLYYPASADGEEAPLSPGGPFPVIALAHERRLRASEGRPGAPSDLDQDYRQLSGLMAHLARWGFVVIAPDLSWLTPDDAPARRAAVLRDALTHLRAGSKGPLLADFDRVGLIGHGLGALAALALASDGECPFQVHALALLAPLPAAPPVASRAPGAVLILRGLVHGPLRGLLRGLLRGPTGTDDTAASLYERAAAPKHLVTIPGATHFGYTTSIHLSEPLDAPAALPRREQQAIAKGYVAAFFNQALRNARDASEALAGRAPLQGLERFEIAVQSRSA